MNYEKNFCVFIDILGFKNKMENFDEAVKFYNSFMKSYEAYSSVHSNIQDIALKFAKKQNNQDDLKETIFSDSILLYSKDWKGLLFRIAFITSSLMEHGFVCRGGIGYGNNYSEIEPNRIFIVSEGLVQAVELESKISNYPRIVLSDSVLTEIVKDSKSIYDTNNMLIQSEDNHWFINPFFF